MLFYFLGQFFQVFVNFILKVNQKTYLKTNMEKIYKKPFATVYED